MVDMTGEKVLHGKFGVGIVKDIADGRIIIEFDKKRTLTFPFPDAFNNYLTAEDENVQKALTSGKNHICHGEE